MVSSALVVDNNPVILKLLDHHLQQQGLQVRLAVNGLEALEILDNFHPDIIFTDLIMPYIGGEKLCRIISRRPAMAGTLLVVVSAIALEENIDVQAFGAHACIAKGPGAEMAANIDLVLSLAGSGRLDLLTGMRLGSEHLVHRAVTGELLAAKKHLQVVLESIDNGVIEFSPEDKVIACNSVALHLLGKEEFEVLGTDIRELFIGQARDQVNACLDRYHALEQPVTDSPHLELGDRLLVCRIVDICSRTGRSAIMLLRDITEEVRSNRQLQLHLGQLEELVTQRTGSLEELNSELQRQVAERERVNAELEIAASHWSNTFDTITDFVSVHDRDFRFIRVNKALVDFLGIPATTLIGSKCFQIMHGQDQAWPGCPHQAAIATGASVTFEVNDAHIGVPLLVTCSPLLDEGGELLGTVHVARDISGQKQAAAEREKLIGRLEAMLAKVKLLSGFIPICAACKKIRDDQGYWQQVEEYIRDHSEAQFSHSICPSCSKKLYPDLEHDTDD